MYDFFVSLISYAVLFSLLRLHQTNGKSGAPPTSISRQQLVHYARSSQQSELVPGNQHAAMVEQQCHVPRERLADIP